MSAATDPAAVYTQRRAQHQATADAAEARFDLLANLRLGVFIVAIVVALGRGYSPIPVWPMLTGLAAAFVGLMILHEQAQRRRSAARDAVRMYDAGLARLAGQWSGTGDTGARFAPKHHPCAADLDLFGEGSLFQYLNAARTQAGMHALASWLTTAATPEVVRARQSAIAELRDRLDLREDLARVGQAMAHAVNPEILTAWAAGPVHPRLHTLRRVAMAITAIHILALAYAGIAGSFVPVFGVILVSTVVFAVFGKLVRSEMDALEEPAREWPALSAALARLEREPVQAPLLKALHEKLVQGGVPASAALKQLDTITRRLDQQRNAMLALPLSMLLWGLHGALAIQGWRVRHGAHLADWLEAAGALEALSSLARYHYEHPDYPFPEIVEQDTVFEATALGHPLLPADRCVRNDITLGVTPRLVIVSGSNMSGKSTFLRSIGVNAVLALAGAPVCAISLRLSPVQVGATMHVLDSVQEGASRFYAELLRIKRLVDAPPTPPVLFLLDEVLHGTNSHDRLTGARALLTRLLAQQAIGLISTHDLALTELAQDLPAPVRNVHFADDFADGKLAFDYTLREGVVHRSNALQLMASLGLIDTPDTKG